MNDPIAIIGLDCAAPRWVFDEFRSEMPNLGRLMAQGSYGRLQSCHPPITVPAWTCLASGYDAGQLGIYGFRNRKSREYEDLGVAFSSDVHVPRLWDAFSQAGGNCICLGVPQTFPIVRPPRGIMVTSFLTPDKSAAWCWPPELAGEIDRVAEGDYLIDVRDFRTHDKHKLLAEIHDMTRRRFAVAEHLVTRYPWDLFFMVEMGPDRLHHGLWHFGDPAHPRFAGHDHPLRWALRDYYRQLDGHIGSLLGKLPTGCLVLVISDHGAQAMRGGVAVNEWLARQGYLVLRERPAAPSPLSKLQVDWPRTIAWSEGGYYARVFLNVRGREPQGCVAPADYEAWRTRLTREMEAIPLPEVPLAGVGASNATEGDDRRTRVFRPENLFIKCTGIPPDLMCYWGNLSWRSVGSVGWPDIYVYENDTGPDEANHDWYGIFISGRPLAAGRGYVDGLRLLDVGVSLLAHAGLPLPPDSAGRPSMRWATA